MINRKIFMTVTLQNWNVSLYDQKTTHSIWSVRCLLLMNNINKTIEQYLSSLSLALNLFLSERHE